MTRAKRKVPHPEWVQMYQRGMSAVKIAAIAGVAESTVRHHLRAATDFEPEPPKSHSSSNVRALVPSHAGEQKMREVIALFNSEGRLPSSRASTEKERGLASWLVRRRREAKQGVLADLYRRGLDAVPDWDAPRMGREQIRWESRLAQVIDYLAAGNDWPRIRANTEAERLLGVWLHVQRSKQRSGQLEPFRRSQLDRVLPGWERGRTRGRKPSSLRL